MKKQFPKDFTVRQKLGNAYLDVKEYTKAKGEFLYVLSVMPNHITSHIKLGQCYEGLKKYKLAEIQYLKAESLGPTNISPYYLLINMYIFEIKSFTKAKQYLNKAEKISPNDEILQCLWGDYYVEIGVKYMKKEEYRKAIKRFKIGISNYQKAIKISSSKRWKKYAKDGIKRANKLIKTSKEAMW